MLSDYVNSTTSIKVRCKICGKEWTPRADTLKKIKCTTCEKSNKYRQQVKEILPDIEILDPVIYKVHDHVKCKCNICGCEWNTGTVAHLKQGHGCPACAGNLKKSNSDIENDIINKHPNLKVLKINNINDITVKCQDCGNVRTSSLWKILNYSKCEVCSGYRWNDKVFKERMLNVNPDIKIIGTFTRTEDKIETKCKKCGRIWFPKASNLLEGSRCTCQTESKGEILVKKILDNYNISYIKQYAIRDKSFSKSRFMIDFYLPDYNMFIEYNGKQHYVPIKYFGGEI